MNSASDERDRLDALLAALNEPERAAVLPSNDPLLIAVARHHRLTPLLSIRCGEALPASLAEAFRRDRVVTAARNMILGQGAEECIRALATAGIPAIVLKGLEYESRLYGLAGARPTADVDLLVPNDQRRLAFGVLDRLGFEPRAAAPGFDDHDYHEVAWTRANLEVDLHLALAPFARCRIDYAAIWAEAEPFVLGGTPARALARPHAAIFQALHMAIDHFEVPAIYLFDLMQLLPSADEAVAARVLARRWHCERPLDTSAFVALSAPAGAPLAFGSGPSVRARAKNRRLLRVHDPAVSSRTAAPKVSPLRHSSRRAQLLRGPISAKPRRSHRTTRAPSIRARAPRPAEITHTLREGLTVPLGLMQSLRAKPPGRYGDLVGAQ